MQWHIEMRKEFVPASYPPILHGDDVSDWPLQHGVTGWTFCSTCGLHSLRSQNAAIGVRFNCPKTPMTIRKEKDYPTGCRRDCYRQRDLETNGATPTNANYVSASIVQWRRQHRELWHLDDLPRKYATGASYAQPQREDWPVYDPDIGAYVEWSLDTQDLESMLELDKESCEQLRCVWIYQKMAQERCKSRRGPTYTWKKLSTSMGRWEAELAEHRCTTAKANGARR